jgi:hypothetical protein
MKICPTCKRNWDKDLHNWSEVVAGIAGLSFVSPILILFALDAHWILFGVALISVIVLYVACIVHLYSEMRTRKYRK